MRWFKSKHTEERKAEYCLSIWPESSFNDPKTILLALEWYKPTHVRIYPGVSAEVIRLLEEKRGHGVKVISDRKPKVIAPSIKVAGYEIRNPSPQLAVEWGLMLAFAIATSFLITEKISSLPLAIITVAIAFHCRNKLVGMAIDQGCHTVNLDDVAHPDKCDLCPPRIRLNYNQITATTHNQILRWAELPIRKPETDEHEIRFKVEGAISIWRELAADLARKGDNAARAKFDDDKKMMAILFEDTLSELKASLAWRQAANAAYCWKYNACQPHSTLKPESAGA